MAKKYKIKKYPGGGETKLENSGQTTTKIAPIVISPENLEQANSMKNWNMFHTWLNTQTLPDNSKVVGNTALDKRTQKGLSQEKIAEWNKLNPNNQITDADIFNAQKYAGITTDKWLGSETSQIKYNMPGYQTYKTLNPDKKTYSYSWGPRGTQPGQTTYPLASEEEYNQVKQFGMLPERYRKAVEMVTKPIFPNGGEMKNFFHNFGTGIADVGLSAIGANNVINEGDYKGPNAETWTNTTDMLGQVSGMVAPAAMNAVLPGSGMLLKAGQQTIGKGLNNQYGPTGNTGQLLNYPTFPYGGINQMPNAQVEKQEVMQFPNGTTEQVNGPSHANGGVNVNIPDGTRIFSDRLKASTKKTFAKEAEKFKTDKEEKILKDAKADKLKKATAELMLAAKNRNLDKLFQEQESLKMSKVQKYAEKHGIQMPMLPYGGQYKKYPDGGEHEETFNPTTAAPAQLGMVMQNEDSFNSSVGFTQKTPQTSYSLVKDNIVDNTGFLNEMPFFSKDTYNAILKRQNKDSSKYKNFTKQGSDIMNRTDAGRTKDSEKYIEDILKKRKDSDSVIIDIGSALGNKDSKLAGITVKELYDNPEIMKKSHIIATDIPGEMKVWNAKKDKYNIDTEEISDKTFNTDVVSILKNKNLSNASNIILRASNSIDLIMDDKQTIDHFKHIGTTLIDKEVTYIFNNAVLYKGKGEEKFKVVAKLNNAAFDHKSADGKDWQSKTGRTPYNLLEQESDYNKFKLGGIKLPQYGGIDQFGNPTPGTFYQPGMDVLNPNSNFQFGNPYITEDPNNPNNTSWNNRPKAQMRLPDYNDPMAGNNYPQSENAAFIPQTDNAASNARGINSNQPWMNNQTKDALGYGAGFLAQNAGNLAYLAQQGKKYDTQEFYNYTPSLLSDKEAMRQADVEGKVAAQNIRNASGGNAGTYLSNRVALGSGLANAKAKIKENFENQNAQIKNQGQMYNIQNKYMTDDVNARNKGQALSNYYNTLNQVGQGAAGAYKDYRATSMDRTKIGMLPQIFEVYKNNPELAQMIMSWAK